MGKPKDSLFKKAEKATDGAEPKELTAEDFEAEEAAEKAHAEAEAAVPVLAPVAVEPAPVEYKLGFNHDKMRKSCGKCGCTQILSKFYSEVDKDTGLKKKLREEHTCNDCKTVHTIHATKG